MDDGFLRGGGARGGPGGLHDDGFAGREREDRSGCEQGCGEGFRDDEMRKVAGDYLISSVTVVVFFSMITPGAAGLWTMTLTAFIRSPSRV